MDNVRLSLCRRLRRAGTTSSSQEGPGSMAACVSAIIRKKTKGQGPAASEGFPCPDAVEGQGGRGEGREVSVQGFKSERKYLGACEQVLLFRLGSLDNEGNMKKSSKRTLGNGKALIYEGEERRSRDERSLKPYRRSPVSAKNVN